MLAQRLGTIFILSVLFAGTALGDAPPSETIHYRYVGKYRMTFMEDIVFTPLGLALDSEGYIYTTGNKMGVRQYRSDGVFMLSMGYPDTADALPALDKFNNTLDPYGDPYGIQNHAEVHSPDGDDFVLLDDRWALPIKNHLITPTGIAVTPKGRIVTVDDFTDYVQTFTSNGAFVSDFPVVAPGERGAQFQKLSGVIVESNGDIDVVDSGHGFIQQFSQDGTLLGMFGEKSDTKAAIGGVACAALDTLDRFYIADNTKHKVSVYDKSGNALLSFGSEGKGAGQFGKIQGVAVDPDGSILVSEYTRVQIFNAKGEYCGKAGEAPLKPAGSFLTDAEQEASLVEGGALVVDKHGKIYVSDSMFIKIYEPIADTSP